MKVIANILENETLILVLTTAVSFIFCQTSDPALAKALMAYAAGGLILSCVLIWPFISRINSAATRLENSKEISARSGVASPGPHDRPVRFLLLMRTWWGILVLLLSGVGMGALLAHFLTIKGAV